MSVFFLVLYIAAAAATLAVGLSSGRLGLRAATIAVAAFLTAPASASRVLAARRVTV